jgi:hypothetical protein
VKSAKFKVKKEGFEGRRIVDFGIWNLDFGLLTAGIRRQDTVSRILEFGFWIDKGRRHG